ncbi:prepilin peptidase [Enterococcus hirae]|nr:prepilin peptidase [Enterococcus hirae]EMF0216808.1 prepilin peptidase [Enterococcus hirae]
MFLYFIIGCCIGSFLCLVAQRLPQGHSIIYPRSHCVNCQHVLAWYELVPLLSICYQRFRCRNCRSKLSPIYFIAECIGGCLSVWLFYFSQRPDGLLVFWFLSAFLLSLMDSFYLMIEGRTPYFIWFILWMTWLIKGEFQWLIFAVLFLISFFLTRYGSECLGLGDVLLLLSWSGGLTLNQLMQLLFLASLLGLLFFFIFLSHDKKSKRVPFVPFLSVALFLLHVW